MLNLDSFQHGKKRTVFIFSICSIHECHQVQLAAWARKWAVDTDLTESVGDITHLTINIMYQSKSSVAGFLCNGMRAALFSKYC